MFFILNININIFNKTIIIKHFNYFFFNEIFKTFINFNLNINYLFLKYKTKIILFIKVIILLKARFNIIIKSNIIEIYEKYYL
jgi:hypothetical protein